jgi:hypothetical protein
MAVLRLARQFPENFSFSSGIAFLLDTLSDCPIWQVVQFAVFVRAHALAGVLHHIDAVSLIVVLLFSGSPLAIAGLVSLVVVGALTGQAFRARSHVGSEIAEAAPALAYGNAASSPSP